MVDQPGEALGSGLTYLLFYKEARKAGKGEDWNDGMVEDRVEEGNGGIVERWSNGVMGKMLRVAGFRLRVTRLLRVNELDPLRLAINGLEV